MANQWLGPYKIHEKLDKGLYRLENLSVVVLQSIFNQCRMKLFLSPEDENVLHATV